MRFIVIPAKAGIQGQRAMAKLLTSPSPASTPQISALIPSYPGSPPSPGTETPTHHRHPREGGE
ncbi:hypothetical protein ACCC88_19780, partial [Sphingomonas sp. Sphisp140]|uniref:hypothetical protein n=1 Tax=Sphingomonas sp. Sphisp140 TaxID=3243019 RepID=UPI0039B048AE